MTDKDPKDSIEKRKRNPKVKSVDNLSNQSTNVSSADIQNMMNSFVSAQKSMESIGKTNKQVVETLKSSLSQTKETTNRLAYLAEVAVEQRKSTESNTRVLLELTQSMIKERQLRKKTEEDKTERDSQKEIERQEKEKQKQIKRDAAYLHRIESTIDDLEKMNPGLFYKSEQISLNKQAKRLRDRAIKGEDVSKEYDNLKYQQYLLESKLNRYNQSSLATLIPNAVDKVTSSKKLEGSMSVALSSILGINPVFLQMFGIDKMASWAGKKAVGSLARTLFTPIDWKSFSRDTKAEEEEENKKKNKEKENAKKDSTTSDEDDDGLSNGTGKLKGQKQNTLDSIKTGIESLVGLSEKDKEKKEEKKKEEGSILGTVLKVISTVIGLAVSSAAAILALAGKDMISGFLKNVLEFFGVNEGTADVLSDKISGMLPGAILGFKLGGVKGAIAGALISAGYFAIMKQVDQITTLLNGETIPDNELNALGDMLDGTITGGALGIPFGPPGILAGALLGAIGGLIVNQVKRIKNEANRSEAAAKEADENAKATMQEAAKLGISYNAEKATKEVEQQAQDIKTYLKNHPQLGEMQKKAAEKIIKADEDRKKEAIKYEKERLKVQKEALLEYGTSDLRALTLKQLESIMWDDDAEFEYYLNQLEKQGMIKNNAETRAMLRKAWKDNENTFWGENVDSKRAVNRIISNQMKTEKEILAESQNQVNTANIEKQIQASEQQNNKNDSNKTSGDTYVAVENKTINGKSMSGINQ